ncbi:MAG: ECF-type sigma factor [Isosphaeraceae bacterium]
MLDAKRPIASTRLAAARMAAENPVRTLDATALVHEADLRLVGDPHFDDVGRFFAAAAKAIRRILVEHARDRNRLKRTGARMRLGSLSRVTPRARLREAPGKKSESARRFSLRRGIGGGYRPRSATRPPIRPH